MSECILDKSFFVVLIGLYEIATFVSFGNEAKQQPMANKYSFHHNELSKDDMA